MSPRRHRICPTLLRLSSVWCFGCLAALFAFARPFPNERSPQNMFQALPSPQSAAKSYFPPDTKDPLADFYSRYLNFIAEPSLLTAAQGARAVSYRLICLYCNKINLLVIRLTMSSDGTGSITTTISTIGSSGVPIVSNRSQRIATQAETEQFSRSLEKSEFWSMPTNDLSRPTAYNMDAAASHWVFEGVRSGAYHVVFREGPEQSPFTEMVIFFAKNLSKLEDSLAPRVFPSQVQNERRKR